MKCPYCERKMSNKQTKLAKKQLKELLNDLATMDWSEDGSIDFAEEIIKEIKMLRELLL